VRNCYGVLQGLANVEIYDDEIHSTCWWLLSLFEHSGLWCCYDFRAGASGPGGPPQSSKRMQQTQAQVDEV